MCPARGSGHAGLALPGSLSLLGEWGSVDGVPGSWPEPHVRLENETVSGGAEMRAAMEKVARDSQDHH